MKGRKYISAVVSCKNKVQQNGKDIFSFNSRRPQRHTCREEYEYEVDRDRRDHDVLYKSSERIVVPDKEPYKSPGYLRKPHTVGNDEPFHYRNDLIQSAVEWLPFSEQTDPVRSEIDYAMYHRIDQYLQCRREAFASRHHIFFS